MRARRKSVVVWKPKRSVKRRRNGFGNRSVSGPRKRPDGKLKAKSENLNQISRSLTDESFIPAELSSSQLAWP